MIFYMFQLNKSFPAHTSSKKEQPSRLKPGFHIVVSCLPRSLLNFKFHQKLSATVWNGSMNEIFAKTSNDPQRQPTIGSRFICVIWKQNKIPLATANDPERPPTTCSE